MLKSYRLPVPYFNTPPTFPMAKIYCLLSLMSLPISFLWVSLPFIIVLIYFSIPNILDQQDRLVFLTLSIVVGCGLILSAMLYYHTVGVALIVAITGRILTYILPFTLKVLTMALDLIKYIFVGILSLVITVVNALLFLVSFLGFKKIKYNPGHAVTLFEFCINIIRILTTLIEGVRFCLIQCKIESVYDVLVTPTCYSFQPDIPIRTKLIRNVVRFIINVCSRAGAYFINSFSGIFGLLKLVVIVILLCAFSNDIKKVIGSWYSSGKRQWINSMGEIVDGDYFDLVLPLLLITILLRH